MPPPGRSPGAPRSQEALRRVLLAVRERFSDSGLSLRALATEQNLSERHLARLLRQYLDRTFRQYLREVRIQEAATLLRQRRDYSIKTVAGMVGYRYPSRFGRDFRLYMSCTPAEFQVRASRPSSFAPHRVVGIAMSDS